MKKLLAIFAATGLLVSGITAADWNDSFGMGNLHDNWIFSGKGASMAALGSTISNNLWYATSARAVGVPRINDITIKEDLITGTLKFYIPTNRVLITAASTVANTNCLTVSSTNGFGAKALCVFRDVSADSYQFMVSSNPIAGSTLVMYNNLTNNAAIGDELYHMTEIASFTPLAIHTLTNSYLAPFQNDIPFALSGRPIIQPSGNIAEPLLTVLTISNAGALYINGEYYVQPRR